MTDPVDMAPDLLGFESTKTTYWESKTTRAILKWMEQAEQAFHGLYGEMVPDGHYPERSLTSSGPSDTNDNDDKVSTPSVMLSRDQSVVSQNNPNLQESTEIELDEDTQRDLIDAYWSACDVLADRLSLASTYRVEAIEDQLSVAREQLDDVLRDMDQLREHEHGADGKPVTSLS